MFRADDWNFPSGDPLDITSLGRIHRGTPWQTLYLKSAVIDQTNWSRWVGVLNWPQAQLMLPTNDWRLVSSLIPLLTRENPAELLSVNEANPARWNRVLNGLVVLTNISTGLPLEPPPQFDCFVMHPNSPQMQTIIAAIETNRLAQPQQIFRDRADILSTPALSLLSPWLDWRTALWAITDEAYEKIPSQLLQRLRSDSIGSVARTDTGVKVRFEGIAGQAYAVEASSDLSNWTRVATNYPLNGAIEFTEKSQSNYRWYRSVLLGND